MTTISPRPTRIPATWLALGIMLQVGMLALVSIPSSRLAAAEETRDQERAELRQVGTELAKLSRAFNLIHEIVAPSVVSIHTRENLLFLQGPVTIDGEGSGFVFASNDKFSYILTNAHVVLQTRELEFVTDENGQFVGYDKIKVILNDNREVEAEYLGYYVPSDLAVLKIPVPNLPAVEWADSDQGKVGDWVVALGYPMGVGYSATSGIISATDRSTGNNRNYQSVLGFDTFIQTDAAINPGNSGGPLVNIMGQVIGINARLISKSGGNSGIGFAIPSNMARRVAEEILEHGHFSHPVIGVMLQDRNLTPEQAKAIGLQNQSVRIETVVSGSPAEAGGLESGDFILSVNQLKVVTKQQFLARIISCKLGMPLEVRVWRNGTESVHSIVPISEEMDSQRLEAMAKATIAKQGILLKEYGMWLASDDKPGLRITRVEPDSVASEANLEVGDRILHEVRLGALRSLDDVAALARRRELVLQIYKTATGNSMAVRLRR